ncbi:hypothetical protein JG687_00018119 [Phytophthora cactorum]|uniref:Uncharacterized protein n=1 Tax=Phytophthora cactorum TaxID=29920 RepID=A0A8T1TRF7_9STRA|nr:hypothetical protein JG687_00018119 [Phytophthora cactorum]
MPSLLRHQAAMTIPNASEVSTLERPDVDQYASLIEGLHGTPHCLGISISEVIWHELPGVSSHAWFHLRSSVKAQANEDSHQEEN